METKQGARGAATAAGTILGVAIAFETLRMVTRWPDVAPMQSRLESGAVMILWAVAAAVALMRDRTEKPSLGFRAIAIAAPASMIVHGALAEILTRSHSGLAFVAAGLGLVLCFMRLSRTEAIVESKQALLPSVTWVPRSFGYDKGSRGARGLF